MRIGVFLGQLTPQDGGGFTFQDDIFAALRRHAEESTHEFVILGNFDSYTGTNQSLKISFRNYNSRGTGRISRLLNVVFADFNHLLQSVGIRSSFDRLLTKLSIDLVWFVTPFSLQTDVPYFCTVWDLQHRVQPWFPEVSSAGRWTFREHGYKQLFQRAVLVLTPNSAGQDELQRYYQVPVERIRRLPHPTPKFALDHAETDMPRPKACADLTDYLFYPAQFGPHKNHVGLLLALVKLKEQYGAAPSLVLVGADLGNQQHVLGEISRLGLEKQVRLAGFVPRSELLALYKYALALVFPTYFGPENLPPLEAFALGCPVIASRVAGAEEQFENAAELFNPADPVDIANAIYRVISDEKHRLKLIERGRARAHLWKSDDYVRSVLAELDLFENVRACWP